MGGSAAWVGSAQPIARMSVGSATGQVTLKTTPFLIAMGITKAANTVANAWSASSTVWSLYAAKLLAEVSQPKSAASALVPSRYVFQMVANPSPRCAELWKNASSG